MKCEHGQAISKFCISEQCDYKMSAACHYCLKKNHFHLGHLETLSLRQVQDLINALSISKASKQKQSTLKELLINYFQVLKTQINKSLETVCKNMIDRISHSYLFHTNMLQSYKKILNKEYGKVSSNSMRELHLLNLKHTSVTLQQQEERYYFQEVQTIQQTIEPIKNIFEVYQNQLQSYDKHFTTDSFFYKKIIELTEKILISHSNHQVKQTPTKNKPVLFNQSSKNNPQSQQPVKLNIEPQQPKLLSLQEYRYQKTKSTQSIHSRDNLNSQLLKISKAARERKFSIAIDDIAEIKKRTQSQSSDEDSTTPEEYKQHSSQLKSPIQKLQKIYKKDSQRLNLKKFNYKIETKNEKEGNNISICIQQPNVSMESDHSSLFDSQGFHWKQCNSVVLDQTQEQSEHKFMLNNKKIKIPLSIDHDFINPARMHQHEPDEDIKKKIVKYQMRDIRHEDMNELQSPLFKKKYQHAKHAIIEPVLIKKTLSHNDNNEKHEVNGKNEHNKPYLTHRNSTQEESLLSQDQLNSMALLLESLKLPSEKALIYLRKSFQYCHENLSTAEYLSYILLEINHPKECLQLCNLMINKIYSHTKNYNFSVHILNNKAAALNVLGRFSETIQFLEHIIEHVSKDSMFKNLGDAFFSLSLYDKAIQNYKKCLEMNKYYDETHYNLAVCYYTKQQYQKCLDSVSEAIKLNSQRDQYIELYRNTKIKVV